MNLNRPKIPFLRSPRLRILALLCALFMPACATTQKPEPAKKSAPASAPKPKDSLRDTTVEVRCNVIRETVERLIKNGPRGIDDLSIEELELFEDCEDLRELQEQKGGRE